MTTEFQTLLRELIAHYGGTKQELASAIQVTPWALSHLLAGNVAPSADVCLRLATATGASPSKVLRAAGKSETADRIEDLYGAAATRRAAFLGMRLSPPEQRMMTAFRTLTPKGQRAFLAILHELAVPVRAKTLPFTPRVREATRSRPRAGDAREKIPREKLSR